jgi:hypothetical protein
MLLRRRWAVVAVMAAEADAAEVVVAADAAVAAPSFAPSGG